MKPIRILALTALLVLGLAVAGCSGGFGQYMALVGMTRTEVQGKLGDRPTPIDEGGLMFPNSGIRVWFDGDGKVIDVYIDKANVDFRGARVGGTYDSFKKAFGTPIKEDSESAYAIFPYKGIFLDVNYDPKTSTVVCVHILKQVS